MPKVSVIVPTYNGARTVGYAIKSVLAQTFADIELIVVDDQSKDQTLDVVRMIQDPRLTVLRLPHNSGSHAMPISHGIAHSVGDIIAVLGHDDLWLPWHLETLVHELHEHDAEFVHALCARIAASKLWSVSGPPAAGASYHWHAIPISTWVFRRSVSTRTGPLRTPDQMPWSVNRDFVLQAIASNCKLSFVERLTTLTFPSDLVLRHNNEAEPIQQRYWQRIQSDSVVLERDLLSTLATKYATLFDADEPPIRMLSQHVLRSCARIFKHRVLYQTPFRRLEEMRYRRLWRKWRGNHELT